MVPWHTTWFLRKAAASSLEQGLFAIPSMTTLRISPYSCYPDWFDGRSITVDANGPDAIIIRVATNGHDPQPQRIDCSFADASAAIARLCCEQM